MHQPHFKRATLLGLFITAMNATGADAYAANLPKYHKSKPHNEHHAAGTAGKTAVDQREVVAARKALGEAQTAVPPAPPPAGSKPAEDVEAIEVVEPVEGVEAIEPSSAAPSDTPAAPSAGVKAPAQLSLADRAFLLLGHLHAAVVHLPIAWVLMWLVFDVASIWLGQSQLLVAGRWLGAMATLSFVPAVASGLLRFDELSKASADAHTMDPALVHRNLMYWALGLCAASYLVRSKALAAKPSSMRIMYTVMLIACFIVVGFSAHLGGELVYGEDFLRF